MGSTRSVNTGFEGIRNREPAGNFEAMDVAAVGLLKILLHPRAGVVNTQDGVVPRRGDALLELIRAILGQRGIKVVFFAADGTTGVGIDLTGGEASENVPGDALALFGGQADEPFLNFGLGPLGREPPMSVTRRAAALQATAGEDARTDGLHLADGLITEVVGGVFRWDAGFDLLLVAEDEQTILFAPPCSGIDVFQHAAQYASAPGLI